jgi:glutaminyl-tRNA synthetase
VVAGAKVEPSVADDPPDTRYQFERTGYFWRDPVDGVADALVFNRIVGLKDTWAKRETEPTRAVKAREPDREPAAAPRPSQPRKERQTRREMDPELRARFERYRSEFGVIDEHAELLASSPDFFEAALAEHGDATAVASWIVVDLRGLLEGRTLDDLKFGGRAIGRLAALVDEGKVSRRAAKDVLARMVAEGGDPDELVESMGLEKVSDPDELGAIVDAVLEAWPDKVAEYREGKKSLIGLFVGEVMKQTGGAADPATAKRLIGERLHA